METKENKMVNDPAPQEEVGKAAAEIPSPSKESVVDEGANEKETEANQGGQDQENHGKEITDKDAEDKDVRNEVMAGKKRHLIKEATLFPMFFSMFSFRLVAAFLMFPLGVLLLVSGNWLNTGEFGMEAIASKPWPDKEVEENKEQQNILHSCALIGWILGFFILLNFLYNVWTFVALGYLIFDKLPWARERWNQARVAADEFLKKVREESLAEQFHRLNKAQMESMAKHDDEGRLGKGEAEEKDTRAV